MTQETEREALLRDMRVQVAWTDEARMPIPLYERVKAFISSASLGKGEAKPVEVGELKEFARNVENQCCWCGETSDTIIDAMLIKYNVTKKEEV